MKVRITHTGCPKKHIFKPKRLIIVTIHLYQCMGSPENFSLYKVGHVGANGSKCITKARVGENDPLRVSQKTYFLAKKAKDSHHAPLSVYGFS